MLVTILSTYTSAIVHLSLTAHIYLPNFIYTPLLVEKMWKNWPSTISCFFCCSNSLSETYFSEHELFSVGGTTVSGEHVKLWHHKCEK